MKLLKWCSAVQVALVLLMASDAAALEIRRRTLLVLPNQPAEKAPQILVRENIPTALLFEEEPKAVKLETTEDRVTVNRVGKLVILVPLVELGNRERIILTVTAPDGARFTFGVQDGFNSSVDSQITVRRGKAAVEPATAESFAAFVLAQDRADLKEIAYRRQPKEPPVELQVEGAVTALGFAIILVTVPGGLPPDSRMRIQGEVGGELEIIGAHADSDGLKIAVKKPAGEIDVKYTLEITGSQAPALVNHNVHLWPAVSAQRTWKK